jgi:TolB-like protein
MNKRSVFALLLALCGMTAFAQNTPRMVLVPLENRAGTQYAYDVETIGELLENFINETQRLNVIDRSALDAAMAARGWRMDDWADNAKAAEMGRALNAQYMVRGTVSRLGDNLLVTARILDIATAGVRSSTNTQLEHMNEAYSKMNSMAQILTYNLGLPLQSAQTAQPVEPEKPPEQRPVRRERQAREPRQPVEKKPLDPAAYRLNSLGISASTSFATPWLIFTVEGTLAPWRYTFFDIGLDVGLITQVQEVSYWSLYPFVRYAVFLPFRNSGGWYAGAGVGLMYAEYAFYNDDFKMPYTIFAVDANTGFLFRDFLNISYTFRLGFHNMGAGINHKLSLGYTYRFK